MTMGVAVIRGIHQQNMPTNPHTLFMNTPYKIGEIP